MIAANREIKIRISATDDTGAAVSRALGNLDKIGRAQFSRSSTFFGGTESQRAERMARAAELRSIRRAEGIGTERFASSAGADLLADRARFRGTKLTAFDEKNAASFTDKVVRAGLILQGIKATIGLITAGVELWKARTADINKNYEKAAEGYLKFADTVKSVPIVGGIAHSVADLISGGAATKAQESLAGAVANDAHTREMVRRRREAQRSAEKDIRKLAVDAMEKGIKKDLAEIENQFREEIASIQHDVEEKRIGGEIASQLKAARTAVRDRAVANRQAEAREENERKRKEVEREAKDTADFLIEFMTPRGEELRGKDENRIDRKNALFDALDAAGESIQRKSKLTFTRTSGFAEATAAGSLTGVASSQRVPFFDEQKKTQKEILKTAQDISKYLSTLVTTITGANPI